MRFTGRVLASNGSHARVSFWWILAAFISGGWAGVLVVALMHMTGGLPAQSRHGAELNELRW
jgi:hypothetical protein